MSPREALLDGARIASPSVGTWRPSVGPGHPVVPGAQLGVLWRDGRALAILAPPAAWGVVTELVPAGTWVAFDDALFTCGEGGLGEAGPPAAVDEGGPEGCIAVRAETDGTVYLRPDPASPAFAAVGDVVVAQATLALVEVMKTFTPVRSPVAGEIARVDAEEGGSVATGAPLVWIRPS